MQPDDVVALVIQRAARAYSPVVGAPRLSSATNDLLRMIEIVDEHAERRFIQLPVERPLTVVMDGRELVTLMTLGASPEWLVLGYLRNQRLIDDTSALASIEVDWSRSTAVVTTHRGAAASDASESSIGTGCSLGAAFGDVMTQMDAIELAAPSSARISQTTLLRVLETMRQYDAVHRAAGTVHSCALFQGEELLVAVEDVSRHNGVDTIAGWMLQHGVTGRDKILFTTGRLTGEMVIKAAHNGVPIMVSRNGVTAMGYDLAVRTGMALFTRAVNRRFLCCAGADRFDPEPPVP